MLWLAQWKGTGTTSPPTASSTPLWGKYDFWQWSDEPGRRRHATPVPGIGGGGVDRDVFDGTVAQLLALRLGNDHAKPGDFNRDGKVDSADYNVWSANNGKVVPLYTGADANGDAKVDGKDLAIWTAAVPEPASACAGDLWTRVNWIGFPKTLSQLNSRQRMRHHDTYRRSLQSTVLRSRRRWRRSLPRSHAPDSVDVRLGRR